MEPLSANDPPMVGEYQLRARLGAGGMGRVYLGFSRAGRAVAVKVIHTELAQDAEFRQRFGREVAAARAVSGMYTAPVVAAGLHDDPPWLATAFVPGPSLAEVITRHGPLPDAAMWRLAAGLAEALGAVHACGLVHRDLKPANVLLANDGPHVIDFGISRAFDGTSVTAAGMVVGTPGYMSPEQAEGAQAGTASDVFSLGCVLAYAASGSAPFGGGSAASVLYRVVTGQPDLDGVPGRLRDVISACLAKHPSQRPGLTALATMIAQAGPAITATPTSFWPGPVAEVIAAAQAFPTPTQVAQPAGGSAPGQAWPSQPQPSMVQPGMAPPSMLQPGVVDPGPQARVVPDGYLAAATASMGGRQPAGPGSGPGPAGPGPGPGAGFGSGGPGQPASWPPTSAGQWQQPLATDPMSRYAPAPLAPRPPTSVFAAIWLMYAGAGFSLLDTLVSLTVIGDIKKAFEAKHPLMSASAVKSLAAVASLEVLIGGAVVIGLWLWLAYASKQGRGWTRIAGTVLFGIHTFGLFVTYGTPGLHATKGISTVVWLIGLATVVLLWQRSSGQYFAKFARRR
jgi:Protein kinase domain